MTPLSGLTSNYVFFTVFIANTLGVKINDSSTRIVGGSAIDISQVPFIVSIIDKDDLLCGGSYIKPLWVLTAAHCLVYENEDVPEQQDTFVLKMGSTYWNKPAGQVRKSTNFFIFRKITENINDPDIGLIKINSPFNIEATVAMVKLAPKKMNFYNEMAFVAGWGTTKPPESRSLELRATTQPIITNVKCRNLYEEEDIPVTVPEGKVICTNLVGQGTCNGDSGSPLVLKKNNMQIGLVAWNEDCGMTLPNVYTDVSFYADWIASITHEKTTKSRSNITEASTFIIILNILFHFVNYRNITKTE